MRPLALAVVALVALPMTGCVGIPPAPTRDADPADPELRELVVDGETRELRVHVPDDLADPTALVVMLHGGFGGASQAEAAYGWNDVADREGVVVAYPDGVRAWNAGDCCGAPAREGRDDLAFLEAVVAELRAEYDIPADRVFATGMSNGAMMTYTAACHTDLFAAIAPVAGTIVTDCVDPSPTSVLHIHGAEDDRVRLDGEPGGGAARVDGMPVEDAVALWREAADCAAPSVDEDGVLTVTRAECADDRVVELILIGDIGHQWPGGGAPGNVVDGEPSESGLDATERIWEFFAAA